MRRGVSYRLLLLVAVLSVSIFSLNTFVLLPAAVVSDQPRQLLQSAFGTFPGENGKIAFVSDRDGWWGEIYVMNVDGSGQTRLTTSEERANSSPDWSPDGTKIAFTRNGGSNADIYVMNVDGSGQTRLTDNTVYDAEPSWSPDGTKIAFTSSRHGGISDIYVMNADGSGQTRLTTSHMNGSPDWSPDGTKIAFTSYRNNNGDVYVVNADGTSLTRLTTDVASDSFPSWSPDSTRIAFVSDRDGNLEIYVVNADGSNPTNISNNFTADSYPSWSPDGTKIAFVSVRDNNQDIYVMNVDGSGQTRLTDNTAADRYPDWGTATSSEEDTTPPFIAVPEDMVVNATSEQGAKVPYTVSAEDDRDGTATLEEDGTTITQDDIGGNITISCDPSSGSEFPIGDTEVQCTATDEAGNEGTASFTVTVNPPPPPPTDTTPPVITVPEDITEEATSPDGAEVSFEVTAEDDVDGPTDVTCDYSSGDTFPIGETVVTCSAEDLAGNNAQESFTITVEDTTSPEVEITEAIDRRNREVADGGTTPTPYIRITFEATDVVGIDNTECSLDGQPFTSCTSPVVYDRLSRGTHEVNVRSTDAAGNTGEDEFTWTVGANPSSSAAPGRQ